MSKTGKLRFWYFTKKFSGKISAVGSNCMFKNAQLAVRGNGKISFGGGVLLNTNSAVLSNNGVIQLGKNVSINKNSVVVSQESITIGAETRIGPNVCIYDHDHVFDLDTGIHKSDFKRSAVVIGENCWIGANVVILRGTHIGNGCVIGAGVVISGNIPDHSLVKGTRELTCSEIHN